MTSQARIDANRKNAQKSTGPRTDAGKARCRLNGLKHGLRSEEVVLPTEDRSAFESHMSAWMEDWKPCTETRRFLVERAATAAWRIKRCVRNETARIAGRVRKAHAEYDKAVAEAVERAVRSMPEHPERAMAELMGSRPGVDRLVGLWDGLRDALGEADGWRSFEAHHNVLCHLLGITGEGDPANLRDVAEASARLVYRARPDIENDEFPPLGDDYAERLRSMLGALCGAKVEDLSALWASMPEGSPARDRYAEARAMEPQAEDAAFHRYEGRLDREARSAIAQLMKLEQTGLDLAAEDDEPSAPTEPSPPAEAPSELNAVPTPKAEAPSEPNDVPGQGLVWAPDRDPITTFRPVVAVNEGPMSVGMAPSCR